MAVKNDCTPSSTYGPFQQTLFLGCSVVDFSVSAGWNEQASTLTVNLVEDSCEAKDGSNKVWYDKDLVQQTTTAADPGFFEPDVGAPVFFKMDEFEFAGLIQNWTQRRNAQGDPVYSVTIVDPRTILSESHIILSDHPGSVLSVFNLLNVYGWLERYGATSTACPTIVDNGITFGSPAGGFGGSQSKEQGLTWNSIKGALGVILSSANRQTIDSKFSRDGRLTYIGPDPNNSKVEGREDIQYCGLIPHDSVENSLKNSDPNINPYLSFYLLDLSEIPFAPVEYRINGPSVSLLELISQVCDDAGGDYYIELLPTKVGNKIEKMIKVRFSSKRKQPTVGSIQDYVDTNTGLIISNSVGRELRNEPTQAFLGGDNVRQYYQQTNSANIIPFWGVDINNDLIQASLVNGEYVVNIDIRKLNISLNTPLSAGGDYLAVTEKELLASLGDFETFKSYAIHYNTTLGALLSAYSVGASINPSVIQAAADAGISSVNKWWSAMPGASDQDSQPENLDSQDMNQIYNYIRTYAQEYYGKQFLVRIPFVCYNYDSELRKYNWSDIPSTEGAWNQYPDVLGLDFPSSQTDFFSDDKGLMQPLVRFYDALGLNFSDLSDDAYICSDDNKTGWVKGEISDKWVVGDPTNPADTTSVSALIKISSPVTKFISHSPDYNWSMLPPFGEFSHSTDHDAQDISFTTLALASGSTPQLAAVPILSNTNVYGPYSNSGPPGPVSVNFDQGLNPWSYGSAALMLTAANDTLNNSATNMRVGERGEITVPGYPDKSLGAELGASSSDVNNNDKIASRSFNVLSFSGKDDNGPRDYNYYVVNLGQWVGTFGPNITNINVSVAAGGITTSYAFATYAPVFGKFSKNNSERLKQIGQRRVEFFRNLRAAERLRGQLAQARQFVKSFRAYEAQLGRSWKASKSPITYLAGGVRDFNNRDLTSIHGFSAGQLTYLNPSGYSGTAIASLDTLFRPVAMTGYLGTGLPRRAQIVGGTLCSPDIDDLNFLSSGHDMQAVAYGTGVDTTGSGGWHTPVQLLNNKNPYDYDDQRFMAMRLPAYGHGWGFDTHGRPIPNVDDTGAYSGLFEQNVYGTGFYTGYLEDPHTWPVAPIDLRFDRSRAVWTAPPATYYLSKTVGFLVPHCFNFAIEREPGNQYTRLNLDDCYYSGGVDCLTTGCGDYLGNLVYDPEVEARENAEAAGRIQNAQECFSRLTQLDVGPECSPIYEAYIIRDSCSSNHITNQDYESFATGKDPYDCGPYSNACPDDSIPGTKILLENPLQQAMSVGDLAITINTGRTALTLTNEWTGGSGFDAEMHLTYAQDDVGTWEVSGVIDNSGTGYAVGTEQCCMNAVIIGGELDNGTIQLTCGGTGTGLIDIIENGWDEYEYAKNNGIKNDNGNDFVLPTVLVVPCNATQTTESLPIHWILQGEFKQQQVVTHVECNDLGIQSCNTKIQVQGFKTCEHCGENQDTRIGF